MSAVRVMLVVGLAACHVNDQPVDGRPIPDAAPVRDAPSVPPADSPLDAPPSVNLSCFGQAFPTTAPPTIDVAGLVEAPNAGSQVVPLGGVTVDACPASSLDCGARLATTTSDAMGNYAFTGLPTGGVPLDAYGRFAKSGELTSYAYPPHPFAASSMGEPVLMLDATQLSNLAGGMPPAPGSASFLVVVIDCAGFPIPGATAALTRNGAPVGIPLDTHMGTVFFFNVPPDSATGGITITAQYMGLTFPSRRVTAFTNGLVESLVRPGP